MLLQNKYKTTIWQFILLMYIATWLISPFLARGTIWRLLTVVCTSYFAFSCCQDNRNGGNKHFLTTLIIIMYIIIINIFTNDMYQHRVATIIFLTTSFCCYFLYNHETPLIYLYIGIKYILCICLLSNIITIRQLVLTPNICRLFAKNVDVKSLGYNVMPGTGGYGYIYTVLLLLPFVIDLTLYEKNNKLLKWISISFLLTGYMLIFKAAYFLALMLAILTFFLYIIFKFPQKMKIDKLIFSILIIVFIYLFFDYIVNIVVKFIPIRSIQDKMLSIQSLLNGSEELQESEFTTRSERYTRSLLNTLFSPLFGWFTYRRTGNHSHLLDFSAQYGLPLLYIYIKLILNTLKKNIIFQEPAIITCMSIFGILTMLNTMAFTWGGVLFIFIPLYSSLKYKIQNKIN